MPQSLAILLLLLLATVIGRAASTRSLFAAMRDFYVGVALPSECGKCSKAERLWQDSPEEGDSGEVDRFMLRPGVDMLKCRESMAEGGNARIFKGFYRSKDGSVAECVVIKEVVRTGHGEELFREVRSVMDNEVKLLEELQKTGASRHLVRMLDSVMGSNMDGNSWEIKLYVVLELADTDLYKHANRGPAQMPLLELCRAGHQVLLGFQELHGNGLFHGDVKPENVLMFRGDFGLHVPEWTFKLTDFGHAGRAPQSRKWQSGSAEYASPEQWALPKGATAYELTSATDIWSFGLMLYQILFQSHAFLKANGVAEKAAEAAQLYASAVSGIGRGENSGKGRGMGPAGRGLHSRSGREFLSDIGSQGKHSGNGRDFLSKIGRGLRTAIGRGHRSGKWYDVEAARWYDLGAGKRSESHRVELNDYSGNGRGHTGNGSGDTSTGRGNNFPPSVHFPWDSRQNQDFLWDFREWSLMKLLEQLIEGSLRWDPRRRLTVQKLLEISSTCEHYEKPLNVRIVS